MTTETQTQDQAPAAMDDELALELGHILWYLQKGNQIEDEEALRKAWSEDYPEMKALATTVIQHMFSRGISTTYYDRDLSHFGNS